MEAKSARLMSYVLCTGLILGFGAFVWSEAFADDVSSKHQSDAVNAIAKTHQNDVGVGHGQDGNPHINAAPALGNPNHIAENSPSAKDLGIHSMVASHAEDNGIIAAKTHDVPLSTGGACTVDPHGDNLIHVSTGTHDQGGSDAGHGHVEMTVHEVKQVLDNVVSTVNTVEAKVISVGKEGEAILQGENISTPAPTVIAEPIVVTSTSAIEETPAPTVVPPAVIPAPTVAVNSPTAPEETAPTTVAPSVTPPAVTPTVEPTPAPIPDPVEESTNPITPQAMDATTNTAIVSHPENIALNPSNVEADTTISGMSNPSAVVGNNALIVVGQIVQKTGNVIEVDANGNGHPLVVGDNVHLGGKFIFNGTGNVVIKSFTGEIINVGQ